ncbi:MAG: hypothetical protein KIT73_00415 [Burkholderiales bacterium]|nr:hypothetical protein [Burkholderiales bacterium]
MVEVSKACSRIFSEVDRDDSVQRRAARDAWLVKSTLMFTALPFNDPRLELDSLLNNLEHVALSVPGIRTAVGDLARSVRSLASAAVNPKRERLLAMLDCPQDSGAPLAILANICGSPTPGWPTTLAAESDLGSTAIELVRLRRQIRSTLFTRLIIPGSPWFAPRGLLFDLLYGGRASNITVLTYRAERVSIPAPRRLPRDTYFPAAGTQSGPLPEASEPNEDIQLDRWTHESFWSSIHAQHSDMTPTSGKDVSVDARFVLFADGTGAFLPTEASVVEISDLFEEGANFDVTEDKLPRTYVRDLEEGDLVMLRLSGSGDYLDDVADSLIEKAGEAGLRGRALQWKDRLHEVIKRHGEGVVAMKVRSLGVGLRSPQYLWAWAGDAVMAPQDRQTFHSLIAVTLRLESRESGDEAAAYADARWDEMERLKAYHHKAGVAIRAALLTRVRGLVAERRRIDSVESIELPGVAAGRMGLLRVSAVDTKSRRVPISRLFHLSKVKVT